MDTKTKQPTDIVEGLVSTVIPVFNRPQMLVSAIESVLSQTYRPIEIIIADDGSTDETPVVAKQLVESHPGVITYYRHENQGPGPSRELGRIHARGEFLQYLDSDDQLLPNKFADQVRVLREHPECDVAYGITRLVDNAGQTLSDPFKWTDRDYPEIFPALLVDRWWCTHTPLYRRSLADKIGPWCDMRWSQDWEYDARIGALKTKIVSCGTHVSEHYHHDGVRQTSGAAWTTDPVRLRNRIDLLNALWAGATAAQVSESAPERQHFARWCFTIARQCAAQGLKIETHRCLQLARLAAGNGPGKRGLRLYKVMLACLGGRGANWLASRMKRNDVSQSTMDQSFARQVQP